MADGSFIYDQDAPPLCETGLQAERMLDEQFLNPYIITASDRLKHVAEGSFRGIGITSHKGISLLERDAVREQYPLRHIRQCDAIEKLGQIAAWEFIPTVTIMRIQPLIGRHVIIFAGLIAPESLDDLAAEQRLLTHELVSLSEQKEAISWRPISTRIPLATVSSRNIASAKITSQALENIRTIKLLPPQFS